MPATAPEHSLSLTRPIHAAASDIYAAWTEPSAMARWLGKVIADLRVGGRYRYESPEAGGKTFVYTGEYLTLENDARVVQTFLAGEPDNATPNPYPNEFIEVRLRQIDPTVTELTFINGWDGEALSDESINAAKTAWSQWLDRMEKSVHEKL